MENKSPIAWQQDQFSHDKRNHSDIICLHKIDRLKHYGLHFAKYVGRIARGVEEDKPISQTVVDCALVCLSAANCLNQHLENSHYTSQSSNEGIARTLRLADAAGKFCDACEKIDHLEEFVELARDANQDIFAWVLMVSAELQLDLQALMDARRLQLKERQFFIKD